MNDLLKYYPTKGGYVVGKSAKDEHPNMEKMPDYRPEEDLDFRPILDPRKLLQMPFKLSQAHLKTANMDDFPDEPNESDDEELLYEPEMDDYEEINLTCQIQATLESTEEFKEYVVETDNIDGDHKLSEGQEFVEKLFVGQQWLSKEHCRDYLKDLALDLNHSIVQVRNKKKQKEYKCKDETCPWRVYCSVLSNKQTFECKKGHFIHTCEAIHGLKHPLANARWVSKVMLESFKEHPNYKPRDFITEAHPRALNFISDRQKGLIEGVVVNFSDRNHYYRYCFRHLYKNFKKLHPGKNLEFMTWRAARSFTEVGHKIWMDRLKEAKASAPEAYFDRSSKCEHVTSNFCEAFNSWILNLRRLPVCKLVQKFHLLMMRIFYNREQVGKKMPDDGVHLYFSHEFTTHPSSENIWKFLTQRRTYHGYVHSYMYVDTYRDLYNSREVKPPKCDRPPGRPRFLRRRDRDEGGNSIKYMCRRCYVYGHNRSTCKGASAEDQHQAPETYTGPHVRPDPGTRPPPPLAYADQTIIAPAPRNKPRTTGGGRKRRGGATQPHA
ncbi:hypothetical protein MKW98_004848 [Papaver atlanticum]|uniref:Transposase MuDR plant domain-containing protein n=1 Tax=Papaver atlanticum TaxID=357466 RepID=A0AAD4XEJ5_9MAGN|nr:hypothetical protein MKW98_004848 [Papaver atlanticum]